MKLFTFFDIAVKSILATKLRSALTMLGMIIGVGAVIILMSVGAGLQNMMTDTFNELGSNLLFIQPANPEAPGIAAMAPGYATASLTLDDTDAIERLNSVNAVVPANENFVKLVAGNEDTVSVIHGSTPSYQQVYGFNMAEGRFLSDVDVARRDMVVVLGNKIAEDLFDTISNEAIGEKVKIRDKRFTIVGIMASRGLSSFGFSWDDIVVVPMTTYQTRLFSSKTPAGEDAVQQIAAQVTDGWTLDEAKEEIETVLRKRHKIGEDEDADFSIISPEQMIEQFGVITLALTAFLGMIGSISLLVGSIGIMNIMLVSVTERTREIGLRKAIGAKKRDILWQFLFEAALLSLSGGAIGLISAWLISWGISQVDMGGFTLNATISPVIVLVAIIVSVFIGLTSGIYPAMRAARLNPIDALHYG